MLALTLAGCTEQERTLEDAERDQVASMAQAVFAWHLHDEYVIDGDMLPGILDSNGVPIRPLDWFDQNHFFIFEIQHTQTSTSGLLLSDTWAAALPEAVNLRTPELETRVREAAAMFLAFDKGRLNNFKLQDETQELIALVRGDSSDPSEWATHPGLDPFSREIAGTVAYLEEWQWWRLGNEPWIPTDFAISGEDRVWVPDPVLACTTFDHAIRQIGAQRFYMEHLDIPNNPFADEQFPDGLFDEYGRLHRITPPGSSDTEWESSPADQEFTAIFNRYTGETEQVRDSYQELIRRPDPRVTDCGVVLARSNE